jgi:hypothetical protein
MSIVAKLAFTGLAGGAFYFAFLSSGDGQSFALPAATAIDRLESRSRIVNGTGMGSLNVSGGDVTKDGVAIWVGRAGDTRRVRCLVKVEPNGETASVAWTDCSQSKAEGKPIAKLGVKAMDIVVREHVAATIDAREYNTDEVSNKMLALAAASAPVMVANLRPPGDEKKKN